MQSALVEVEELDPPKVLGDLLESLAGAIFLDSGMNLETMWRVFSPLFQSKIGTYASNAHFNTFNSSSCPYCP